MTTTAVIVLVCALSSAMANDLELKAHVLTYMEHMFISPDNHRVDKFAYNMFKHGYTVSGCPQQSESSIDYAKECLQLKNNKPADSLMTSLVEKYVHPDKVNGILLWNLALPLLPQIYTSSGAYYFIPKRGCQETNVCGYQLPSKPFPFDANQCERASLYLQLLSYHLEPRDLPMDYYALAYHVLTKMDPKPENIYGLDPAIKLFEIKHFLDQVLTTTEAKDDFVLYMMGRRRKIELYHELANQVVNPDMKPWKDDIEKEIEFEGKLTAMMLTSWMELTGVSVAEDGSLTLKDTEGIIIKYEATQLVI